jgi:Neutral/alkaline non-lysosomal ceramidase, N-terminal
LFARSASCDVTPRDRPTRLAGYAARTEPAATILDPIEVSAVLLECPGQRCLIFSFDLMIVGSELQSLVVARLTRHGFSPGEIILLASHTHFAPATDHACSRLGLPDDRFVKDVADAAEDLLLQMLEKQSSEIHLEVKRGQLNHSINRRRYWPFPTFSRTYGFRFASISMAPNRDGATNELATVLLLRSASTSDVIGVIWHYTCHPTAVIPDNVISADYPGVVRRALRERFGEIPCVFVQGFCGDISPNKHPSKQRAAVRERIGRAIRTVISGPTFPTASANEWTRWSENLAARVVEIALAPSARVSSPQMLAVGSASIPLGEFFKGLKPDKQLTVQIVRLGEAIELVILSAEVTVEWEDIINREIPLQDGRMRLYAGYSGALFGYLPTPAQIRQGGYEAVGFQPLFGLSGHFDLKKIEPAVTGCLKWAFDDIEGNRLSFDVDVDRGQG